MSILLECMSVHDMHAWWPWKSEDGAEFAGTGVTDGCEPHVHLSIKPHPLKEELLLAAELSLLFPEQGSFHSFVFVALSKSGQVVHAAQKALILLPLPFKG